MNPLPTPVLSGPPLARRAGWSYTYHLVISDETGAVLLLRDEEGWALPSFQPIEHDLRAVASIGRAVRQGLGLGTRVLRCVALERGDATKTVTATFTLELLAGREAIAANWRWVARDQLAALLPERPAAQGWADENGAPPWVALGWYGGALRWMAEQCAAHDLGAIVACEQVRTWPLSCVLRVSTDRRAYYLKALAPTHRDEVAITAHLHRHLPGYVPEVIAADEQRGWLLLADAGRLMENNRSELWEAAIDRIAAMQRAAIPHVADLLALGCQDQRLAALSAQAAQLAGDPLVRAVLAPKEYASLHALIPRLQEQCDQLASYSLPATLVHGDLHTGNIARQDDKLIFFDWGDACIAHPFFVLFALLDARFFPPATTDFGAHLRGRYLARWADFGTPDDLRTALGLADSLAALRYTLGCLRCFPSLDPLWTRELTRSLRSSLLTLLTSG